jgi:hypothetical protein
MKTNTRTDALVPWSANFYDELPMYAPIRELASYFSGFEQWPGLNDYRQLLREHPPIRTLNGQALSIVEQAGKPETFSEHYAPRIYYSGEIQTRTNNWHDFFQFLSWFIFPRTKAVINSIHVPLARERMEQGEARKCQTRKSQTRKSQTGESQTRGRRNPVENMLSLFDEGGVVILSSDESLLDHIRDFEWKRLFWQRRHELERNFRCVTFGHAMYEKGLRPYIGMTANAILLHVDQSVIDMQLDAQLAWIDERLAEIFSEGSTYTKPRDLSPFPILGMPGWLAENADEAFYDNTEYFRPGRGGNTQDSSSLKKRARSE